MTACAEDWDTEEYDEGKLESSLSSPCITMSAGASSRSEDELASPSLLPEEAMVLPCSFTLEETERLSLLEGGQQAFPSQDCPLEAQVNTRFCPCHKGCLLEVAINT